MTWRALLCAALLTGVGAGSGVEAAEAVHDAKAEQIVGRWLTEPRDGIIEITESADGTYSGRIIGGDSPNRTDSNNPDPARRGALLLGQTILQQLKYHGDGQWADGSIYDPDSGRTYHCKVELQAPDRLKVRGFIGVSLLGRSQVWTRYQGSSLTLPPTKR